MCFANDYKNNFYFNYIIFNNDINLTKFRSIYAFRFNNNSYVN